MSGKVDVQADYLSPAALQAEGGPTPGVSCAAGGRVNGGGRWHEAAARQCAYGRLLERRARWVGTTD